MSNKVNIWVNNVIVSLIVGWLVMLPIAVAFLLGYLFVQLLKLF